MAITTMNGTREQLLRAMEILRVPTTSMTVVELGNQYIKGLYRQLTPSKSVWEWLGAKHISIDLNGRDGALQWDLRSKWDPFGNWQREWYKEIREIRGTADLITNFGTIEHVENPDREYDQVHAWAFVHDMARPGGLMVHALPHTRSCRRHGAYKYNADWAKQLADTQRYHIHELYAREFKEGVKYLYAIFEKRTADKFSSWNFQQPPTK